MVSFGPPPATSPLRASYTSGAVCGSSTPRGKAMPIGGGAWKWSQPTSPSQRRQLFPVRKTQIDDIEGTRPALKKFSKWNQRIMPDPYPDRPAAPRMIDHKKYKKSPLYVTEADLKELDQPYARQLSSQHPFYTTKGTRSSSPYHSSADASGRPHENAISQKTQGLVVGERDGERTGGHGTPVKDGYVVVKDRQVFVNGQYRHIPSTRVADRRCLGGGEWFSQEDGHRPPTRENAAHRSRSPTASATDAASSGRDGSRGRLTTSSRHGTVDIEGATPRGYYERLQARRARTPQGRSESSERASRSNSGVGALPSSDEPAAINRKKHVDPTAVASSSSFPAKRSRLDVSDIPGASPRQARGTEKSPARANFEQQQQSSTPIGRRKPVPVSTEEAKQHRVLPSWWQ